MGFDSLTTASGNQLVDWSVHLICTSHTFVVITFLACPLNEIIATLSLGTVIASSFQRSTILENIPELHPPSLS